MKGLRNRICIIIAVIIVLILTVIFNIFTGTHKNQLLAKEGTLDLVNWNFKKDGVVSLEGEWEFYWNQLLTYEDFQNENPIKPDGYFKVPSVWTNYILNGKKISENGYATYRLKVKTNNMDSLKGLKILTSSTSYKLMVNNQVVAEMVLLGRHKEQLCLNLDPKRFVLKIQIRILKL